MSDEQYRLALNHLTSKAPLWFTLADCIASKLLTGRAPKVLKAWRFAPRKVQSGLKSIDIAGNPSYRVDPAQEDFYKRLIDLRQVIKGLSKSGAMGQRALREHEQLAIKNVANATSYGIFIELNPEDRQDKEKGTCFGSGEPFPIETEKFEQPGMYFHPLIATFTTGAARLMLATAECLAVAAGLDWTFCDTDSMAIAKPDGMSEREFLTKANGVRDWFTPLNPYTEKGPLLKFEDDNYRLKRGKPTDHIEPLFCYAISPKRYALFNRDRNGRPVIRKALAHGLGHLLSPLERGRIPSPIPKPVIPLREMDIKAWQYSFWYRILESAQSGNPDTPIINDLPGFRRPAATRYGASTPNVLGWCKGYNKDRAYRDRIKPFNFMLGFHAGLPIGGRPLPGDHALAKQRNRQGVPGQLRPIAPYDRNPMKAAPHCFDRVTGEKIDSSQLATYAQELAQYHIHPDSKFRNAEYFDQGVTQRRHVIVANIHHIGKELDHLEEQLEHGIDPDAIVDYGIGLSGERLTLDQIRAKLKAANLSRLAIASGIARYTLTRIRDGEEVSKASTTRKILIGIQRQSANDVAASDEWTALLSAARAERDRIGLRDLARQLDVDRSTLAQVLAEKRPPTTKLTKKLERLFFYQDN